MAFRNLVSTVTATDLDTGGIPRIVTDRYQDPVTLAAQIALAFISGHGTAHLSGYDTPGGSAIGLQSSANTAGATSQVLLRDYENDGPGAQLISVGDVVLTPAAGHMVRADGPIERPNGRQLLSPGQGAWASDTGATSMPLQLRMDASGVVHCWGLVRNMTAATVSGLSTIAPIPAGYACAKSVQSVAWGSSGACRVDQIAGGTLSLMVGSVPPGGYLGISLSWPGPDLTV